MKGCNEKHGCTFLSYKVYSGIVMQKKNKLDKDKYLSLQCA